MTSFQAEVAYSQCVSLPSALAGLPLPRDMPIALVGAPDADSSFSEVAAFTSTLPLGVLAVFVCALLLAGAAGHARGTALLRRLALLSALVSAAPVSFWASMKAGEALFERSQFRLAGGLGRALSAGYPVFQWVPAWTGHADPGQALADASLVAGIQRSLRLSAVDDAVSLARWAAGVASAEARTARSAALNAAGSRAFVEGRYAAALDWSLEAAAAAPASAEAGEALQRARYATAWAQITAGPISLARESLDGLDSHWRPQLQAMLEAAFAHAAVEELGSGGTSPSTFRDIVTILASSSRRASDFGSLPPVLTCELAAAYEVLALAEFEGGGYASAVSAVRSAASLVPDSPLQAELLPLALHAKGVDDLANLRLDGAIEALQEALDRYGPTNRMLVREDLSSAWTAVSRRALDETRYDDAVAAGERAVDASQWGMRARNALAAAQLARADDQLRRGAWRTAEADLKEVLHNRLLRAEARIRVVGLAGAKERIEGLNSFPWAPLPEIVGEVATRDFLLYFTHGGSLVASRAVSGPPRVVFAHEGGEPSMYLEDHNGDRVFDDWTQFPGGGRATTYLDVDGDLRPDLHLEYVDEQLVREEALSGVILLHPHSGVIATAADVIGRADTYLQVFQNQDFLMRSEVAVNTQMPTWRSAVVVDFRYGDVVDIEIFDEDVFTADDYLGAVRLVTLPRTGQYTADSGAAAIAVRVDPTDLPAGHVQQLSVATRNEFQRVPIELAQIEEIVAVAARLEHAQALSTMLKRFAVTELLVAVLLPRVALPFQILGGFGIDAAIASTM